MEHEGLKAALEFTSEIAREAEQAGMKKHVVKVGEEEFYRGGNGQFQDPAHEIEMGKVKHPSTCTFSTLEALVGYAKASSEGAYLHVVSPQVVYLAGDRQLDKARDEFAVAKCDPCPFDFDSAYSPGNFYIAVLAGFKPTETTKDLLELFKAGLKIERARELTDDGTKQEVVTRSASGLRVSSEIDPLQHLAPWRTFREIEQPESPFYFRVVGDGDDWRLRLILADGGAWRIEAVAGIRTRLEELVAAAGLELPVLA